VVVSRGAFEFPTRRDFGAFFLHGVASPMSEHSEVVRSVAEPGSVLVLIHHPIQSPVQAILHGPVLANDFVEPLRRQGRAEQAVRGFGARFVRRLPHALHLADGRQPRPLVLLFAAGQSRWRRPPCGFQSARDRPPQPERRSPSGTPDVEQTPDIVMQRTLVGLQRQRKVTLVRRFVRQWRVGSWARRRSRWCLSASAWPATSARRRSRST
jgi:hypothetical protein